MLFFWQNDGLTPIQVNSFVPKVKRKLLNKHNCGTIKAVGIEMYSNEAL